MRFDVTFPKPFEVFDHSEIVLKDMDPRSYMMPAGTYRMMVVANPFGFDIEKKGGKWLIIEGTSLGMSIMSILRPEEGLLFAQRPIISIPSRKRDWNQNRP